MYRLKAMDGRSLRSVALTLAFLALVLKVAVPPGFMIRTGEGPLLIPCIGQWAMPTSAAAPAVTDHAGHAGHAAHETHPHPGGGEHKESNSAKDCAFAGHGSAALSPAAGAILSASFADYPADLPVVLRDLAPGRGLTAPPLPARGPPLI